jgi:comEA protein
MSLLSKQSLKYHVTQQWDAWAMLLLGVIVLGQMLWPLLNQHQQTALRLTPPSPQWLALFNQAKQQALLAKVSTTEQSTKDNALLSKPQLIAITPADWSQTLVDAAETPNHKGKLKGNKHPSHPKKDLSHTPMVSLNKATPAQLALLPGIGEKTARRITAYRNQHGPFSSVDNIMDVKGIGVKKFAKMKRFLTL